MANFEPAFRKLRAAIVELGEAPMPSMPQAAYRLMAEFREFPDRPDVVGRLRAALWDAPGFANLPAAVGAQMIVVAGFIGPRPAVALLCRSLQAMGAPLEEHATVTDEVRKWLQQTLMRRGGDVVMADVLRASLAQYLAGVASKDPQLQAPSQQHATVRAWTRAASV